MIDRDSSLSAVEHLIRRSIWLSFRFVYGKIMRQRGNKCGNGVYKFFYDNIDVLIVSQDLVRVDKSNRCQCLGGLNKFKFDSLPTCAK